ncbi:MAG: DnaJ domain-containing protein, partial [Deltaproteobacteria bacterium]|nr:DnaJ domain-containing protein [Deltaproteobacteria bacterium]
HRVYTKKDAFAVIEMERQKVRKKLFFKNGDPVGAKSNVLSECIGRLLLREGIINQDMYEKALEIMLKEKRRQGEIFLKYGAITPHQLNDMLCLQVKERLLSIFAWDEGIYNYKKIDRVPEGIFIHSLNPADAILTGLKNGYFSYDKVEGEIRRNFSDAVVLSKKPVYNLDDLHLNPQERRILNRINGITSLERLIRNSKLPEKEALPFIYGMAAAGLIYFKEKKPASHGQKSWIHGLHGHDRIIMERLSNEFARLKSMNYFEIFNVSRFADNKAVKRTYFKLAKEYHPDKYHNNPCEIRALASDIFTFINIAYNILCDEGQRLAYEESIKVQMKFNLKEDAAYSINAELQFQKGRMALLRKDYKTAAETFERAIRITPNEAEYKAYLGWAVFNIHPDNRQHIENARELIRESVAVNPNQDRAYYFLGVINRADGKLKEAETALNKAVERNPNQRDAWAELRNIKARRRKQEKVGLFKRLFKGYSKWRAVKAEG